MCHSLLKLQRKLQVLASSLELVKIYEHREPPVCHLLFTSCVCPNPSDPSYPTLFERLPLHLPTLGQYPEEQHGAPPSPVLTACCQGLGQLWSSETCPEQLALPHPLGEIMSYPLPSRERTKGEVVGKQTLSNAVITWWSNVISVEHSTQPSHNEIA